MSISVQCTNVHFPWSTFSGYFGTLCETAESNYQVSSGFSSDNNSRIYQFSTISAMPCCRNYVEIANETKYMSAGWTSQVLAESRRSCRITKTDCLVRENPSYGEPGNASEYHQKDDSEEKVAVPGSGNTLKIWRPFSPPPSTEMDKTEGKGIHYQNSRSTSKNNFFTIKPSNVKIGQSKMSVFKAVKKNSFTCNYCTSRYQSNRQLNTHMRMHIGKLAFSN